MKHKILKRLAVLALGFLSFGAASAQDLWSGVATYRNYYRFLKVDIDRCPTIAREYGCLTIPVVILFEKGKEQRRITSAVHTEEDIYRFITGE